MQINFKKVLCGIIFSVLLSGCAKQIEKEELVFFSDFETPLAANPQNLKLSTFNNSTVAGFYNAEELVIELKDLPAHELAIVEFDLFIHDTWDGNSQVEDGIGGPDKWMFSVDGKNFINTTFSNAWCPPGQHCPPQSYPYNYPHSYSAPRTGAFRFLPGVCAAKDDNASTGWYKISRTIDHTDRNMKLSFKDELIQLNHNYPICDESWSMDNLRILVLSK